MTLRIQSGRWQELEALAAPIRLAVFVEEQGVPLEMEWDEFDAPSLHAIAWVNDQAVGTARLLPDGHIGRLAVLKSCRGQGVGRALMHTMIDAARTAGLARVVLHAQCHAEAFYRREGFEARGETFMEAGIPHVEMVRVL